MQPIKKFLEASFRIKVLVPVVAVMGLLLAVMVYIVNQQFTHQAEQSIGREMRMAGVRFQNQLVKHQNNLCLRFGGLAGEPRYRAAFQTLDAPTIRDSLERLMQNEGLSEENIDLVFFSSIGATNSAAAESMVQQRTQFAAPRAIVTAGADAVRASRQRGAAAADSACINGKLFEMIAIPVYNVERRLIGTLTLGEEINWKTAQEFSLSAGGPTVFFAGGSIIASTFSDAEQTGLTGLFNRLNNHAGGTGTQLESINLGNHNYYYSAGRFPSLKGDASLGYLLFNSYDEQLGVLHQTRRWLLTAIIIGILLGSLTVLYFINKATQPLRELHDAAEAVGRGDFSHRVNVQTKDEFGELAHAFNQMTENIELSQSKLKQTVETLKTTQAQLIQSEKLSAVGEFVAGVAHELNNPLAAVMGFSEMLKNADVGEKHSRHLELIFKSAERCKKIVQSLLSFARRQQPERKPAQVNQLIEEVLEMIAYPLRTSNVKVVTNFSSRLPIVLADGHQIQQVVLNLVNNARQAIEAAAGAGSITITTTHVERVVRIIITDSGPGISPENLKRIFDPFFTTKEVGKGTGLGLSLCYGIIHEHGGNILATSQPGKGATFTIELPAAMDDVWTQTTKTATHGHHPGDLREGAGKNILVVDDEASLLHMIREELTRHSYEVTTVENGENALRELRARKFDAIVCDLKMPGLNGRQVYERLRAENPEASRRMVFVTGDLMSDSLRAFLETEQRPCLTKPFSLGELRLAVQTLTRAA